MLDTSTLLVGLLLITNLMLMAPTMPYLPKKRKHEIVLDIAYSLVWEAERLWGAKTGHIKRAYVKAKLYVIISAMPSFRTSIINKQSVENTIDEAYAIMQKYMDEVKNK